MSNQNYSLTITGKTPAEMNANLVIAAQAFGITTSVTTTGVGNTGNKSRNARKMAEVEETVEVSDDDADLTFVEDEEELEASDVDADDVEEEEEETSSKTSITKQAVQRALRDYAARGKKFSEKAYQIIQGYGVKHIDDVPKKHYAAIIKALK